MNSAADALAGGARDPIDWRALVNTLKGWGLELGFAELGIARADVSAASARLLRWLELGRHGEMHYMAKHAALRADPPALVAETQSVISARLPYWPAAADAPAVLADGELGYVSRYALGRDYHKTLRQRLQKLAERIGAAVGERGVPYAYRVFADSAPVMEVEFARQSGIAWRGKHTLSLTRSGSWHFLGEIYCSLPLPPDAPIGEHCGSCTRCLDACPTAAIVAPYEVDARRCISYLTIELPGAIPVPLRPLVGNRIYGCDDCQLICPWNRYADASPEPDFSPRPSLHRPPLLALWCWSESDFLKQTEGSPIRRIGYQRWRRNLAVALGNGPATPEVIAALQLGLTTAEPMVAEHIEWALATLARRQDEENKKTRLLIRCIEKGLSDHA